MTEKQSVRAATDIPAMRLPRLRSVLDVLWGTPRIVVRGAGPEEVGVGADTAFFELAASVGAVPTDDTLEEETRP